MKKLFNLIKKLLLVTLIGAVLVMSAILVATAFSPTTWDERIEDTGHFLFERAKGDLKIEATKETDVVLCMGQYATAFLQQEAPLCEAPRFIVPVGPTLSACLALDEQSNKDALKALLSGCMDEVAAMK